MKLPRTVRGRTALFYLIVIAAALLMMFAVIAQNSRPRSQPTSALIGPHQLVLLDAGHGGQDGGATVEGVSEAPINLAITRKTALLLRFLGQDARLTRMHEESLDFNPSASVRQNKNADLKARLAVWKAQPGNAFLSIHLNQFSEEKYAGAQVFYSVNAADSKLLAETLQTALCAALDPTNTRQAKPCKDVFLMEQITGTAVTVECGFLSNGAERAQLQEPGYQTKTALAIAYGYLQFITGQGS